MKTIRKTIQEIINNELDTRGLLEGDLATVLADRIQAAIQERKDKRGVACPENWMSALYGLCGIDPYTASIGLRSQISECGKVLLSSGAELKDLDRFENWWKLYTAKWTIESRHPSPKQIRDNWGKFKENPSRPVEDRIIIS